MREVNPGIARKTSIWVRHCWSIGMEPSCPLYFHLYPPAHLLPGLQDYLGDTTPLAAAIEHGDSSNRWRKGPHQETSSWGLKKPLVVGSRKLVFLHSTLSKWCRVRVGKTNRGEEEVKGGGGWSKEKETGEDRRKQEKTVGNEEVKRQIGWLKENEPGAGEEPCIEGGVLVRSILHADSMEFNFLL